MGFIANVIGISQHNRDGTSRQKAIAAHCRPGKVTHLVPEIDKDDENSVGVWVTGRSWLIFNVAVQIGYLEKRAAVAVTSLLRKGGSISATIAKISGGTAREPLRNVALHIETKNPEQSAGRR